MIKQVIENRKLTWWDVTNPTSRDMELLKERFGFHDLALDDCTSQMQRPKIDEYPDHLFVVLFFPYYQESTDRILSDQVSIFLGNRFMVSVHSGVFKPIEHLINECSVEENVAMLLSHGAPHLFYTLVDRLVDYCLPMLDKMSSALEKLETEIFSTASGGSVQRVSTIRRHILNFRKIIGPERSLIANLEHKHHRIFPSHLDIFFDDIMDHIEKIWQTLENQLEIVRGLGETNESLISYRTNEIIKVLTLFSVSMLPLSLLAGMWGMNFVNLPFADNPYGFWIVAGLMVMIMAAMLTFFVRKKWIKKGG